MPPPCALTLEIALAAVGEMPAASAAGMPAPLLYEDGSRADEGLEGLVVDEMPLSRGLHPVHRWFFDPRICGLSGGETSWAPPPGPVSPPRDVVVGLNDEDNPPTWRLNGVIISGEDPGADVDAAVWAGVFNRFGASARHLHRPPPESALEAIQSVCSATTADMSAVIVLAGRGSSGPRPGLVVEQQAIVPFDDMVAVVDEACDRAGLVVLVADTSHVGEQLAELTARPSRVVWSASGLEKTLAPRTERRGGGLLSAALAPAVSARVGSLCLGVLPSITEPDGQRVLHPTPDEVARAFLPPESELVARMASIRTTRYPGLDPASEERLLADLPATILTRSESMPPGGRCTEAANCGAAFYGCETAICQAWRCVEQRCLVEPAQGSCDDGNPCTVNDACDEGICVGAPRSCDDDNACTVDICSVDNGCEHLAFAEPEPCDDDDACTDNDRCTIEGACLGTERSCDDGNVCTDDRCDPETGDCDYDTVASSCDDGDPCSFEDYCQAGQCAGLPVICDDGDTCTADSCDATSGECVATTKSNGAPCEDANPCTLADVCEEGACVGTLEACDDGLDCTVDGCDPNTGGCSYIPAPGTCAGPSGCVEVGTSLPDEPCRICTATNVLSPVEDGTSCADDGIACTDDLCIAGQCIHPASEGFCVGPSDQCVPVGEALTPCLVCSATGVASGVAEGAPCDDGNPCTEGDTCTQGVCSGELQACCTQTLAEELSCGVTLSGTTVGGQQELHTYTCSTIEFGAPERVHTFTAQCAGLHQFFLSGSVGLLMILVDGGLDACSAGQCDSFTPSNFFLSLEEGDQLTFVVDGTTGYEGAYQIEPTCPASCP